jgi:ubiquinone/menaquinone biosynthesis C-methylase UbiE
MNTEIIDLYNKIGGESYNKRGFTPISFYIKKNLLAKSQLKKGDKVLVLFCGSGQDFRPILDVVGPKGEIVGVDFSSSMLAVAQKNNDEANIKNITLIEDDVLKFEPEEYLEYFDAVFCSMGIALDDDSTRVYNRLSKFQNKKSEIPSCNIWSYYLLLDPRKNN